MSLLLALIALTASLVFAVYVVRVATRLSEVARSLREELRSFKEGGVATLVTQQMDHFREAAQLEVQQRERDLKEGRTKLVEEHQKATQASQAFSVDIGVVRAKTSTRSIMRFPMAR
jgi:Sec-independent protein translocase protein TatA